VNTTDVISGVAYGTDGGPRVITVNHSAHTFWAGAAITDLVANCRGSALETLWTARHRGISRCATVPIPLVDAPVAAAITANVARKHEARKAIGVPTDATVIITVGAFFKFLPVDGLDFVDVYERILEQVPEAYLLAVGFEPDSRWSGASRRLGSRVRALGAVSQSQLAIIHDAADIYAEGFPFGTTTSLLEAGLKGIPVVLSPAQCPPPYGSDGVALDETVERSRTLAEYKSRVVALCRNQGERALESDRIRNAVGNHHTGAGWKRYLDDALSALPDEHAVQRSIAPIRTPEPVNEYWSRFVEKIDYGYEETLERAVARAISIGLRPRLTKTVIQACKNYRSVRINRTIPLPLLRVLCNAVLPVLPSASARETFRLFSGLCRRSLLSRVRGKAARLLGGTSARPLWWEEYRHIRD
jgi:hypothetical protein